MKKTGLYLTLMVAGLMIAGNMDAKIWRINNNPGKTPPAGIGFATLTEALRSPEVSKGVSASDLKNMDTLHIEGSTVPYGKNNSSVAITGKFDVDTIRRPVVIIGPGYLLGDNAETQHNKESAKFYSLFISKEAAGTVIAGLEQVASNMSAIAAYATTGVNPFYDEFVQSNMTTSNLYTAVNGGATVGLAQGRCWNLPNKYKLLVNADNVTITHCKLFYLELYNLNASNTQDQELKNITVTKCFFNPGMLTCRAGGINGQVTNLIISNCFFRNEGRCIYNNTGDSPPTYPTYGPVQATTFLAIDLRGKITSTTGNNNQYNTDLYYYYGLYSWPVIQPTIQNNTFYASFNIAAKSARIYNNLFFPTNLPSSEANSRNYYGLPVWAGTAEHTTSNNIIYNGLVWTSPSSSVKYGGMAPNEYSNTYSNQTAGNWFTNLSAATLDKSFVLPAGSPALDASNDATKQRGMYGGLSPYVLSGLYTIPAVWEITIPAYPSGEVPSTGFEVRVKVKSH
jgi:hypothetical protein